MIGMLLMICLAVAPLVATQRPNATNWKPLEFFVGSWDGQETGTEGTGTGRRTYEFELGGRYLVGKNRSVFPPQDRKPKGEVHEDWEIFSYDEGRKLYVLRQFHIEGFVVQLRQDIASSTADRLVFVSESVENGPPGLQVRATYEIKGPDEFVEIFEVSEGFNVKLTNIWKRSR